MQSPLRRPSHSAFTIVEILVVVAIIGVLVAVALPIFSGVQQRAQIAKTLNNLKQLYQANRLHAAEYNGFFVPHNSAAEGAWLNNDRFKSYIYEDDHNAWDDWPSIFKTASPDANTYATPDGVISKMSLGLSVGWDNNHWEQDKAFRSYQADEHPQMVMFADGASHTIRGLLAEGSAEERDESQNNFGHVAFRYGGKACVIQMGGSAVALTKEELLPESGDERYDFFPRKSPGTEGLLQQDFDGY